MSEETKDEVKKERVTIRDVTPEGAASAKEIRFTKRFFMDWLDEDDIIQSGEFVIKRPTIGERARIGTMLAELREDKPLSALDAGTAQLHEWIAICTVCVTQSPPWFKPSEMYDSEPLQRVYQEVLAFSGSFRKALGK